MESFFAYRLPHSTEVVSLKGRLVEVGSILELSCDDISFCSYDGLSIYRFEKTADAQLEDIKIVLGQADILTTKESYFHSLDTVSSSIKAGETDKVVISRVKQITSDRSPIEVFHFLNNTYKNTFNYILSSQEVGCWIGASPEVLCNIDRQQLETVALAGTKTKDEEWTTKEMNEQQYVVDYIEFQLRSLGCSEIDISPKNTVDAGPVQHLKTEIIASIPANVRWQEIVDNLHPTPATCGIPLDEAKKVIRDTENHNRSLYTGFIGIPHSNGVNCFVNLRCMQYFGEEYHLYLGGGITSDSIAQNEWEETERKAKTLEAAFYAR